MDHLSVSLLNNGIRAIDNAKLLQSGIVSANE